MYVRSCVWACVLCDEIALPAIVLTHWWLVYTVYMDTWRWPVVNMMDDQHTAVKIQTAVTAYFTTKQIFLFVLMIDDQYTSVQRVDKQQ